MASRAAMRPASKRSATGQHVVLAERVFELGKRAEREAEPVVLAVEPRFDFPLCRLAMIPPRPRR
jgi:hypothetical protein